MIVFLNGRYFPEEKAHISVSDHGFLYGDGLYDTLRVRRGKPVFLREHLARFASALRQLHFSIPFHASQLSAIIASLIQKNKLSEASVRITVTRGAGSPGLDPRLCAKPTVLVTARSFFGYPVELVRGGLTLAVVGVQRNTPRSTPPGVKSISCLNGVLAKIESLKMGADEALLLTERGHIAEGSVSNVFIVKNGVLYTPRLDGNQLPGVTRALVCRLARRLKIPLREQALKPAVLFSADEVFLTNALMNVMRVKTVLWKDGSRARRRDYGPSPIAALLANNLENDVDSRNGA